MILVDTSVWVDHLRRTDAILAALLERGQVLTHPIVVGEIACGSLSDRELTLELLQQLPMAAVAEPEEALGFTELRGLQGRGLGYVDLHLLASTALNVGLTGLDAGGGVRYLWVLPTKTQGATMQFSTYLFFDGRCEEAAAFYKQAVTMPLTKTFWSPKFGMLTARFGMSWMIMVGEAS